MTRNRSDKAIGLLLATVLTGLADIPRSSTAFKQAPRIPHAPHQGKKECERRRKQMAKRDAI